MILLGPPGAGKGTQAAFIKQRTGFRRFPPATCCAPPSRQARRWPRREEGDGPRSARLRRHHHRAGARPAAGARYRERLPVRWFPADDPASGGDEGASVPIDYVLEIDVPDAAIIERMSGRRVHPASGRTYHVKFNPPKMPGKDDVTGEALIQRDDDKEETVCHRLAVYHAQTEPLIAYYAQWGASGDARAPKHRKVDGLAGSSRCATRRSRHSSRSIRTVESPWPNAMPSTRSPAASPPSSTPALPR